MDLFNSVPSRMKAEMIRKKVVDLIDLWEKSSLLPKLLCQNLRFMFTSAYRDEVLTPLLEDDPEEVDGSLIEFPTYWNPKLKDNSIDGDEIQV